MENLFEKLLNSDATLAEERQTETFYSKRLAKILGESEPVAITLQELPYERLNELMGRQFDKKGRFDYVKSTKAKAYVAVEGIVNPNFMDEKLIKHFGCFTATEVVEKIFSMELVDISDAICRLSGLEITDEGIEEEAKEIKN